MAVVKGFTNSAVLGRFLAFNKESNYTEKPFSLLINDNKVQEGKMSDMIYDLKFLIDYVGENVGLDKGDIIFTGTPAGVGSLKQNDKLSLRWGSTQLGSFSVNFL